MRIEPDWERGNRSFVILECSWVNVRIGYVRTDDGNAGVLFTVIDIEIVPKEQGGPSILTIQEGRHLAALLGSYAK